MCPTQPGGYTNLSFGSSFVSLPKPPKTTLISQEFKSRQPAQQTTDLQEFS
jgi:hypothetical protein